MVVLGKRYTDRKQSGQFVGSFSFLRSTFSFFPFIVTLANVYGNLIAHYDDVFLVNVD